MAHHADAGYDCHSRQLDLANYHALVHQGATLFGLQHLFWTIPGNDHLPVHRDNDLIAKNFPEINRKLNSPAFLWPETVPPEFRQGKKSPTDELTFNRFIQSILNQNQWIRRYKCDFTSGEGLQYFYLILSTSSYNLDDGEQRSPKLRVWLQSGVHGNEPAGDQSMLALLGKMNSDQAWTASLLEHMDIIIFPRYNADGVANFNRTCALGIDLNRDHVKLTIPQSRHIKRLFCKFAPHIAIDMHEFSAKARFRKYAHGSDIMFAAAKNLNIHSSIRELSETLFVTNLGTDLRNAQFRWEPYVPTNGVLISFGEAGSDGKIGRNAMGLTQCISILAEARGIGIADQHFHRRTAASLTFLESILETAKQNAELVRNTVEQSIRNFVDATTSIVMSATPTPVERTFSMIQTTTGELVQMPVKFLSTTSMIPDSIRSRPEAYLIPASLSEVVDRLGYFGLEVKQVEHAYKSLAEALEIKTVVFGRTYYEGIVPIQVTTTMIEKEVDISAGMYVVSTRQKNAALAFISLEPENVDSYVSSNIIPVLPGEEYPIYRIMTRATI